MKLIKSVKNIIVYGSTIALIGSGIGFHSEMSQPVDENATMTDYLIGAHRGDSSLAIENTKEAIVLASENDEVEEISESEMKKYILIDSFLHTFFFALRKSMVIPYLLCR